MLKAVTHSGTFHADDVFAFAVLKAATKGAVTLIRSRGEADFADAEVVFDVGGVFDPAKGRYDHHMRDKPYRDDGIPYSSVGLIWRDYGLAAIETLQPDLSADQVQKVWSMLDQGVIRDIDIFDNGALPSSATADLTMLLEAWNSTHVEFGRDENESFHQAVGIAGLILKRLATQAAATVLAAGMVEHAARTAADPRILVLEARVPWQDAVFDLKLEQALYVVRPTGETWAVNAVPPRRGSFGQRKPLPESWGGLQNEAFAAQSGVADATFCHPALFICGARSRQGALALALKAAEA